ncbi:hypothetical protein RBB50_000923 [Rhinocladiella similis]
MCVAFTGKWNQTIGSIGPDNGTYCIFFSDDKCKRPVWNAQNGKQIELSYPGKPDMCELGLGDSFGSYVCQNAPGLKHRK